MAWLLLADDDEDLRAELGLVLETQGYEVRTAADGAEVVRLLSGSGPPAAAMILDVLMPRLSGYAALQTLRAQGVPLPPVVVLTAVEDGHAPLRELGVAEILLKPVSMTRLLAAVAAAAAAKGRPGRRR